MTKRADSTGSKALPRWQVLRACELFNAKIRDEFDIRDPGWQKRVAERTGIAQSDVSEYYRIENFPQKGIGINVLLRMAKFVGVHMEQMIGEEPIAPTPYEAPPPRQLTVGETVMVDVLERAQLEEVKRMQGTPPIGFFPEHPQSSVPGRPQRAPRSKKKSQTLARRIDQEKRHNQIKEREAHAARVAEAARAKKAKGGQK